MDRQLFTQQEIYCFLLKSLSSTFHIVLESVSNFSQQWFSDTLCSCCPAFCFLQGCPWSPLCPHSGCWPKFTFSHFTRDPNLHNPHSHKTHINTTPNLHRTQIYKTPDLHHLKFTKPRFTQTQIYTASIIHKVQIYTVPNLQHGPVSGSNVERSSSILT